MMVEMLTRPNISPIHPHLTASCPVFILSPTELYKDITRSLSGESESIASSSDHDTECIVEISNDTLLPLTLSPIPVPPDLRETLISSVEALLAGSFPRAIPEGMGGAYLIANENGAKLAVFKPTDEEPSAPNNQKGLSGCVGDPSLKPGILSGEQALREVAAYHLDHDHLARVPPTTFCTLDSQYFRSNGEKPCSKTGSFQRFVPHDGVVGDYGPGKFDTRQVQAIALLDMRLMNTDRHDGNILVTHSREEPGLTLTPIDHGCCLPDNPRVSAIEWCFIDWPQLAEPIHPSLRASILAVDVGKDAAILSALGIRVPCIGTMCIATTFLQMCVRDFPLMTLRDIAPLMTRDDIMEETRPSQLESLVDATLRTLGPIAKKPDVTLGPEFSAVFRRLAGAYLQKHWAKCRSGNC